MKFQIKKQFSQRPNQDWNDEYLQFMEVYFDEVFQAMYEERFVDRIFGEQQQMNREQFIETVEGSSAEKALQAMNDLGDRFKIFPSANTKKNEPGPDETNEDMLEEMAKGPVEWLFSPKNIRQLFRQHYKTFQLRQSQSLQGLGSL